MTAESLGAGRDVSRETRERLEIYAGLLEKWSRRINLVSRNTLADTWTRHFRDSAQLMKLAPDDARIWCDLGSGGGFPGLVIAILGHDRNPALRVTLIEADQRKATFLRTVARETGTDVAVMHSRAEDAPEQAAHIVSARALAPLPRLLEWVSRHLSDDGLALLPKGARHAEEVRDSLALWRFRCETVPSETDPDAVVLKISELSRA